MTAINHNQEPAFWHLPIDEASKVEAEAPCAIVPPSDAIAIARTETLAMVTRWFGMSLPEEDALDLALSAEIAEWSTDH